MKHKYILLPAVLCLLNTFLTYNGSKLLQMGRTHYDLSLPADRLIPLVPFWMLPYVLCYGVWIYAYLMISLNGKEACYRFFAAEAVTKLLACVVFVALPTTISRPCVEGNDFFAWLTRLIYAADTPESLLPSVHCACSWLAWRGVRKTKTAGTACRIITAAFVPITFCAVLLTKQHVLADIPAAIIVAEAGIALARKTRADRIYQILEERFSHDHKTV